MEAIFNMLMTCCGFCSTLNGVTFQSIFQHTLPWMLSGQNLWVLTILNLYSPWRKLDGMVAQLAGQCPVLHLLYPAITWTLARGGGAARNESTYVEWRTRTLFGWNGVLFFMEMPYKNYKLQNTSLQKVKWRQLALVSLSLKSWSFCIW